MTESDKQLLTAVEYFSKRKKDMERYIEGEHRWFGTSNGMEHCYNDSGKCWYDLEEEVTKVA